MKRATFLKQLGLLAVATPAVVTSLAEEKKLNGWSGLNSPTGVKGTTGGVGIAGNNVGIAGNKELWSESIRQKIELQKQGAKPVTAQWLKDRSEGKLISKQINPDLLAEATKKLTEPAKFNSGRLVQIGDYLLYGLVVKLSQKDNNMAELNVDLHSFHEDEIGVVYDYEEDNSRYASGAAKSKHIFLKKL